MDRIIISFKLNVTYVATLEAHIIDLPRNVDIFQILGQTEVIYIVDNRGNAEPFIAFITVVDQNNNELV